MIIYRTSEGSDTKIVDLRFASRRELAQTFKDEFEKTVFLWKLIPRVFLICNLRKRFNKIGTRVIYKKHEKVS